MLTLKLIGRDGAQILHEALQIGHLLVELLGGCAGRQSLYLIGRVSHRAAALQAIGRGSRKRWLLVGRLILRTYCDGRSCKYTKRIS